MKEQGALFDSLFERFEMKKDEAISSDYRQQVHRDSFEPQDYIEARTLGVYGSDIASDIAQYSVDIPYQPIPEQVPGWERIEQYDKGHLEEVK